MTIICNLTQYWNKNSAVMLQDLKRFGLNTSQILAEIPNEISWEFCLKAVLYHYAQMLAGKKG